MSEKRYPQQAGPTVVAEPVWGQVLVCVVFALIGAGLGWLVKAVAKWLVTLPWAPLQGPAKLVTAIPEPGLTIGAIALGGLVGLVAGVAVKFSELSVAVHDDRVELIRKGEPRVVAGSDIALAFRDGKQLVLLGPGTEELAREDCDQDRARLAAAFAAHGYAWADEDPYKQDFRLWIAEVPELAERANTLLKARAEALRKPGAKMEAAELKTELARVGVVVRDQDKRQYWRTLR
ncbi:YqeB family protein [Streptomyces abikoensis]|uniref:YqeB family protein n=1 Tax=Streptomyces abikoensis TaxID=97398 RepID=UPI0033CF6B07